MFDILVYLYETYYRPDACPEPAALAKKLSAVGFDDVEISEALVWLTDLTAIAGVEQALTAASTGTRFYVDEETDALGGAAIGFMTWIWISTTVVLLGAELNAEMEHQTARDTTVGDGKPLGARQARMADTVAASA